MMCAQMDRSWPAQGSPGGEAEIRRSRRALLTSLAAGAGSLLAACRPGEPLRTPTSFATPAAPVEIEFLHFFQSGNLWEQGFKPIIARFEELHPAIRWKGLDVPYGEMLPKLIALTAAGTPPDALSLPSSVAGEAVYAALVRDIDGYVARDKQLPLADLWAARLENFRFEKKLYALPIDVGTSAIYYNKDAFDAAGLPYPRADWTWDDLLALATRLTRKGGDHPQWGFQFSTDLHWFYPIFAQHGGAYFDRDLTRTLLDSAASIAALEFFVDLHSRRGIAPTAQEAAQLGTEARAATGSAQPFVLGRYAIEYAWIGLMTFVKHPAAGAMKWDVAPIPLKDGTRVQIVGGQGFAITAGARQPDAAWTFTAWMVSDEPQKLLGVNGVWTPCRKSLARYGQPADGVPANFLQAFIEPIERFGFSPWWYVPGWREWSRLITEALGPVWRGERGVSEAVRELAGPLNEALRTRPRPKTG